MTKECEECRKLKEEIERLNKVCPRCMCITYRESNNSYFSCKKCSYRFPDELNDVKKEKLKEKIRRRI